MPKALSPFADEDEKTTIESGWEEEASTTVEQGEVAEKIRTLGLRPITNVTGALDEPTVDDQRANAALSIITPPAVHARLIITMGNDQGQEIEVIPGKSYTIGRAIDNDVVLTDIAVSRKHFDLRFENSAWVLFDRGSGNGTLVNGNIEDNPFMLANGDAIEIGNTTFRFDHPNGVPRGSFNDLPSTNGFSHTGDIVTRNADAYDVDMEEEPSTVAGKPLRHLEEPPPQLNSTLAPRAPSPHAPTLPPRPKTVPPPAPLPRTKPASSGPPQYPMGSVPPPSLPPLHAPIGSQPAMLGQPRLASSPAMAPSVPSIAPHHPTMLAQEQMVLANVMPTTIPGQGPPMHPSQPQMHALPFTYPNVTDHVAHTQHAQHANAKMLVIPGHHNGRDATSTAHVAPSPYNGMAVMQPYVAPQLSRRTKLLLGGAGLTVLAAIATIAIIKGVAGGGDEPVVDPTVEQTGSSKPTASPIDKDKPKVADVKTSDKDKDKDKGAKDAQTKKDADDKAAKTAKDKKDADDKKAKKDADDKIAKEKADKEKADKEARDKVAAADKAARDAANKDKLVAAKEARDKAAADKAARDKEKLAAAKAARDKAAADKAARDAANRAKPKTVAVATPGADSTVAKDQAKALYQQKKFNDAAKVLRAAAVTSSKNDATLLKSAAASYESFGRYYFNALTSTNFATAWGDLQKALSYDNTLGNVYTSELTQRRSQIAGKAAVALVGAKRYGEALQAIKIGEAAGSGDAKVARSALETDARELLKQARAEKESSPKDAKTKANQVKTMMGPGNKLYELADKLLAQISG